MALRWMMIASEDPSANKVFILYRLSLVMYILGSSILVSTLLVNAAEKMNLMYFVGISKTAAITRATQPHNLRIAQKRVRVCSSARHWAFY